MIEALLPELLGQQLESFQTPLGCVGAVHVKGHELIPSFTDELAHAVIGQESVFTSQATDVPLKPHLHILSIDRGNLAVIDNQRDTDVRLDHGQPVLATGGAADAIKPEDRDFFESRIRPLLVKEQAYRGWTPARLAARLAEGWCQALIPHRDPSSRADQINRLAQHVQPQGLHGGLGRAVADVLPIAA